MKEEALELANELVIASSEMEYNHIVNDWKLLSDSADMIRKLVAELEEVTRQSSDVSSKPLSDEEIMKEWNWKYADTHEDMLIKFARAIELKHGISKEMKED